MASALADSQMSEFITDPLQEWIFSNTAAYGLTNFSYYYNFCGKFYSSVKLNEQEECPKNSLWQSL